MRAPTKSPEHLSFFAILKVCPAKPLVQTQLWLRIFLVFCFASLIVCHSPASPLLAHQWRDQRSVFLWNHTPLHGHSSLSAWDRWCQERQMCFAVWIHNSPCFADSPDFSSRLWHSFNSYKGKFFPTFTFLLTVPCVIIPTFFCCRRGRNKVGISCKRERITPPDAWPVVAVAMSFATMREQSGKF